MTRKTITINRTIKITPRAEASESNPFVKKISFVITDDQPNLNNVGIKADQFLSLALSAVFMPIKMELGKLGDHPFSVPMGVITETEVVESSVTGKGVLWEIERPDDISLVESLVEKGEATLSWEIAYQRESKDDQGISWIEDPILLATTLVSSPAYGNRTRIFEISSIKEESNMREINNEELHEEVEELETEEVVEEPTETVEESEPELDEAPVSDENSEELERELQELREFKERVERERFISDKISELSNTFSELVSPESLNEDALRTLVDLSEEQVGAVKMLLSARMTSASVRVPELSFGKPQDSLSILKTYLYNRNAGGH